MFNEKPEQLCQFVDTLYRRHPELPATHICKQLEVEAVEMLGYSMTA